MTITVIQRAFRSKIRSSINRFNKEQVIKFLNEVLFEEYDYSPQNSEKARRARPLRR